MAEKPIIFSWPMVRAIQDNRKSQTRRVIKGLESSWHLGKRPTRPSWTPADFAFFDPAHPTDTYPTCFTARYQVGDLLWVRETWADLRGMGFGNDPRTDKPFNVAYRADTRRGSDSDQIRRDYGVKWKPSIFMPKRAARLWLKVKAVRVERVQDISGPDMCAEGIQLRGIGQGPPMHGDQWAQTRKLFRSLWDSLNAKRGYPWENNNWVFVYDFERVSHV